MMETLSTKHQCQVIMKDPEKTPDPAGIRTQDLLITSQTLLPLDLLWQRSVGLMFTAHSVQEHVHVCVIRPSQLSCLSSSVGRASV